MSTPKADIREVLVRKSLELISRPQEDVVHFINSKPSSELDGDGVDFLLYLKSGMAIPLQVKAAHKTIGIVLPLPFNPENLPQRLKGQISEKIQKKLMEHAKKHPQVKAILFVESPRNLDGHSKEKERALRDILERADSIEDKNLKDWGIKKILRDIAKELEEIIDTLVKFTTHDGKANFNRR